jgi:2,5-diketo-D-gluconate reductase A
VCAARGIVFQCYGVLGSGVLDLMGDEAVREIAAELGVAPAQVLVRWATQLGENVVVAVKSGSAGRQRENADVFGFELSKGQMGRLGGLSRQREGMNCMLGWLREHDPDYY